MFSTGSHSKIVLSDDGRGGWFAALGSCNWLGSLFESFEVSVKIRDPTFCGRIRDTYGVAIPQTLAPVRVTSVMINPEKSGDTLTEVAVPPDNSPAKPES